MPKKIFITGAGGYIGTRMVEKYLDLGYKITALDRFFFGDTLHDIVHKNLKIVKDDIRFFDKKYLSNVDCVIDLASISNDASGSLNPGLTTDINYKGAVRVARIAKEMGVRNYIFASSCSVYGEGIGLLNEESKVGPLTEYARSKLAAEEKLIAMSNNDFNVTILRNATVYGLSRRRMRFDLIINLMTLTAYRDNKISIWGGGNQWRPLVHIDDCIDAFRTIIEEKDSAKINGQIYNVGSNQQNFQVITVANEIRKLFPKIKIIKHKDSPEKRDYRVDFSKINNVLKFNVKKSIQDGIQEVRKSLKKKEIDSDKRTHTLNYYTYLMEAENLLKKLKMKGKLF